MRSASLGASTNPSGGRVDVRGSPPAQRIVIDGEVTVTEARTVRGPAAGPNDSVTEVRPRRFVTVLPALRPSPDDCVCVRPQFTTWLRTGRPFSVLTTRAEIVAERLQRTVFGPERTTCTWVWST